MAPLLWKKLRGKLSLPQVDSSFYIFLVIFENVCVSRGVKLGKTGENDEKCTMDIRARMA